MPATSVGKTTISAGEVGCPGNLKLIFLGLRTVNITVTLLDEGILCIVSLSVRTVIAGSKPDWTIAACVVSPPDLPTFPF